MVMMTEKKIALSTSTAPVRIRLKLVAQRRARVRKRAPGVMREMAEDVFHHDHGAVDDDAEVDRADRQQVGGFAPQHRDHDREQQRHRNGGGDDQIAQRRLPRNSHWMKKDQRDAEQQDCAARCCTVIATRSPRS